MAKQNTAREVHKKKINSRKFQTNRTFYPYRAVRPSGRQFFSRNNSQKAKKVFRSDINSNCMTTSSRIYECVKDLKSDVKIVVITMNGRRSLVSVSELGK